MYCLAVLMYCSGIYCLDFVGASAAIKVQLSRSSRGGRLFIYFHSEEELERIYGAIVGEEE